MANYFTVDSPVCCKDAAQTGFLSVLILRLIRKTARPDEYPHASSLLKTIDKERMFVYDWGDL
jgi:hypothetical protein